MEKRLTAIIGRTGESIVGTLKEILTGELKNFQFIITLGFESYKSNLKNVLNVLSFKELQEISISLEEKGINREDVLLIVDNCNLDERFPYGIQLILENYYNIIVATDLNKWKQGCSLKTIIGEKIKYVSTGFAFELAFHTKDTIRYLDKYKKL